MDKFEGDMVTLTHLITEFGRAKFTQGAAAGEGDMVRAGNAFNKACHYYQLIQDELAKMQSQQPAEQKMQHDPNAGMVQSHEIITPDLTPEQKAEHDRLQKQYFGGDRLWYFQAEL